MTVLYLIQQSCENPETNVFMDDVSFQTSQLHIDRSIFPLHVSIFFYLWPRFYAGSWRPPCRSPRSRKRGGWWSSTASAVERSRGGRWRLGSLWKCPEEATDMESLNKSRLSHQDSAPKTETKFVSPRKQIVMWVVGDAHWCSWFPWCRQRRDVGSAARGRGGSHLWLKWARGRWRWGWGSFGDRRCLQEVECISVSNKRKVSVLMFLLPLRRTRLTGSWVSCEIKWN